MTRAFGRQNRFPFVSAVKSMAPMLAAWPMQYVDTSQGGRTGFLVEYGDTQQIFEDPQEITTKQYIRGEFS
jgi:hypothetical protein